MFVVESLFQLFMAKEKQGIHRISLKKELPQKKDEPWQKAESSAEAGMYVNQLPRSCGKRPQGIRQKGQINPANREKRAASYRRLGRNHCV